MLAHLHVKDLALIREAEIDFTEGLNILTGETGAGKSILIGSVGLALGEKAAGDPVRQGAGYGLAELVFTVDDETVLERLRELGIRPDDGEVILSRRISGGRSINRINGETVTLNTLKSAAALLVDVHGQHESQSLLNKKKHLEILDEYAGAKLAPAKEKLFEAFAAYKRLDRELKEADIDNESRLREISFLEYEINEIDSASLVPGEDEDLEKLYQKMSNAMELREAAGKAYSLTGYESGAGGEALGKALRELQSAASYDDELSGLVMQLGDIDNLLNDFNRELADYLLSLEFDEEEFAATGNRLDLINGLKAKYGQSIDDIMSALDEKKERLEKLLSYDEYLERLKRDLEEAKSELEALCGEVSSIRKECAKPLCAEIKSHLEDLNFQDCGFDIDFKRLDEFTASGTDDVQFVISANPGEPLRPLSKVASGGEISRIMLAIKTVLADRDDIDTVIFDEIDAGISGRTAQKVAEKLMLISGSRQVICITHLAQIAAMADTHFRIEKGADDGVTSTSVVRLDEDETVEELARMLGGAQITDAVVRNASEMRRLASELKSSAKN